MRIPPNTTTVEQDDPLLGQQIGEFRVERMLAAGGMGAVYVMRHVLLPNTRKVLKVILPNLVSMPHIRARFLAEADALSQLGNHPSIVGIDSHMTLPSGQLAIMMPFCEGVPLDEYVEHHSGKLSPHRAFYVACHVARGLHHAHMHGIVHRDLKPSNVFVEDDDNDWGKCKLLDFGIARRLNPNPGMPTHTHVGPCGTPDFMPPEQQDRAAEATSAADVYAFAVMIWWMVTGGYPWGQQSDPAILYVKKLNTPPDPPPEKTLPPQWERWLRAALHPDPAARPTLRQLMQGLAQAIEAVGRFVLSGPEILQKLARVLAEETGPDDPTLRNSSKRTLQPPWPALDPVSQAATPPSAPGGAAAARPTRPPTVPERAAAMVAPAPLAAAAARAHVDPASSSGQGSHNVAPARAPAIPSPPIVASVDPARGPAPPPGIPMAPASPMTTTIGASSGAVTSAPSTPPKWKLAIVGAMAVVVAGGGTFVIATLGGRHSVSEPSVTRQPSAAPPPAATSPAATTPQPAATPAVIARPTRDAAPLVPAGSVPAEPARVALPVEPAATAPGAPPGAKLQSRTTTGAAPIAPAPMMKRGNGTQPDPITSATTKARAPTHPVNPGEHDKATSGHSAVRKFDPNAIVGGEED